MKKILVIQLKRLGDVVLTTPAVRLLAQTFPGAQIDFLVYGAFASILEGNPFIHRILVYPRRKPWRLPKLVGEPARGVMAEEAPPLSPHVVGGVDPLLNVALRLTPAHSEAPDVAVPRPS